MENLLDLYTDYLLAAPNHVTCTGLSEVLCGQVSHDKFTRMLASGTIDSECLWKQAKGLVEEMVDSTDRVVLGVDDTVQAKPYSKENELVCWHYDHNKGTTVKGIQLLSAILATDHLAVPVGADFIRKPLIQKADDGRDHRKSKKSKNERFRELLRVCWQNCRFDYVAADSWFSGKENMNYIKTQLNREFVMAVKTNRVAALSKADREAGRWIAIKTLVCRDHPVRVWLRGVEFPVLLLKQVFKNEDGSKGIRYLVASDLTLQPAELIGIYHKRWKTEEYHKSIKHCSQLGKSPAHTPATQQAHCIAALISYVKLEKLKLKNHKNHFALKKQIWTIATRHALQGLSELSTTPDKYAYLTA